MAVKITNELMSPKECWVYQILSGWVENHRCLGNCQTVPTLHLRGNCAHDLMLTETWWHCFALLCIKQSVRATVRRLGCPFVGRTVYIDFKSHRSRLFAFVFVLCGCCVWHLDPFTGLSAGTCKDALARGVWRSADTLGVGLHLLHESVDLTWKGLK